MVIGCSGAGKSTITRELESALGLPSVHLDAHYWRPGWERPPDTEWETVLARLVAADRWIHDGNYVTTMPMRLPRADLVVFLDVGRWRCLWRVVTRAARREEMAPGTPHRVALRHLRYVWRFPKDSRPKVSAALTDHDGPVVRLRTPRQVRRFIAGLPGTTTARP
ncbi:adenylate kinase family enzyme [Stackebrandtia albiflava]|uniref:Adenylate kinase family enzyme n=2 Tax=Stackebrandtia albiflava TaxID=406432 RepID=A0A562UYN0_9ACTN|nr:adenylate kinase family enzyme [Stackebrandtia albiflava]